MDRWHYGHYAHFILFLNLKNWLLWQQIYIKNNLEFLTMVEPVGDLYCLTIVLLLLLPPLAATASVSLSRTQEPLKSYKLLKFFLMLWKCLELLKADWGRRRLGVQAIESMSMYRNFW